MNKDEWLAEQFEQNRTHLSAVAYRMLGSLSEADDAVQESWLRLCRSDSDEIRNLPAWLTTVVARVCLDTLRTRRSRREDSLETRAPTLPSDHTPGTDPAQEAQLADSVGLALLVVLEKLAPAERVAFVLHDVFDLPFEEIASIVGRSSAAARQLASRARRRVQGKGKMTVPQTVLTRQKSVVVAFLAAARGGDFEALLAVLDPEVEFRADDTAVQAGGPKEVNGAPAVARIFAGRAQGARLALVDGEVGIVVVVGGRLFLIIVPTISNDRIVHLQVIGDPIHLRKIDLAVPEEIVSGTL